MRILLIEDDVELCRSLLLLLERQHFSVTSCHDSTRYLRCAEDPDFRALLPRRYLPEEQIPLRPWPLHCLRDRRASSRPPICGRHSGWRRDLCTRTATQIAIGSSVHRPRSMRIFAILPRYVIKQTIMILLCQNFNAL